MYHVSAQGVYECMINVHYYYYYFIDVIGSGLLLCSFKIERRIDYIWERGDLYLHFTYIYTPRWLAHVRCATFQIAFVWRVLSIDLFFW